MDGILVVCLYVPELKCFRLRRKTEFFVHFVCVSLQRDAAQQHSLLDPSHPVRNTLLVLWGYREEATALSDPIKLHCQDMPIIVKARKVSVCHN